MDGYTKKDGTYVHGYYKTKANNTLTDNLRYKPKSIGFNEFHLEHAKSPEARVCEAGFPQDVDHSARLDLYDAAPLMRGGCFQK